MRSPINRLFDVELVVAFLLDASVECLARLIIDDHVEWLYFKLLGLLQDLIYALVDHV